MARKVLYPDQLDLFTVGLDRASRNAGIPIDGQAGIAEALYAIQELERVLGVPDFDDSVVEQLAALRSQVKTIQDSLAAHGLI